MLCPFKLKYCPVSTLTIYLRFQRSSFDSMYIFLLIGLRRLSRNRAAPRTSPTTRWTRLSPARRRPRRGTHRRPSWIRSPPGCPTRTSWWGRGSCGTSSGARPGWPSAPRCLRSLPSPTGLTGTTRAAPRIASVTHRQVSWDLRIRKLRTMKNLSELLKRWSCYQWIDLDFLFQIMTAFNLSNLASGIPRLGNWEIKNFGLWQEDESFQWVNF